MTETMIVTLRLPKDLYYFVKKYAKSLIINEQFSKSTGIENASILNTSRLENQKDKSPRPSLQEVADEIKRIGASFTAERFMEYYKTRPWPDDWKAALLKWKSYNLEKNTSTTSKNTPAKCDFKNDASFKNHVADLIADSKKGVA